MKTVDAVDSEIRLTTTWGGLTRYVFIPLEIVQADAGHKLCRDDAIAYVRANLSMYVDRATRQHELSNPVKMVDLKPE